MLAQSEVIMCKYHPHQPIKYIYCKYNNPYPSRLICKTCQLEQQINDGLESLEDVLRDPRVIMDSMKQSEKGIYNELNDHFDLINQDPEKIFREFKASIEERIKKLEQDIKEGIQKFRKFQEEMIKVKAQFDQALNFTQFREAFKSVLQAKSGHFGDQWCELEKTIQSLIVQFKDQNNQEVKVIYQNIHQSHLNIHMAYPDFQNYQKQTLESIELLKNRFQKMGILQKYYFTQLCDEEYHLQLIQKINQNQTIQPKITLLFKASQHGMTAQAFWEKCNNQGPTLTICKSKNGYVFGGYSPCKWIPSANETYQKDDSKTSFIFSYTRKEIYPILDPNYAILCCSKYGPTFGRGPSCNIHIKDGFQGGYSKMTGVYYSNESYNIEEQVTHLMGDSTPQLVEMEVFLVEQ